MVLPAVWCKLKTLCSPEYLCQKYVKDLHSQDSKKALYSCTNYAKEIMVSGDYFMHAASHFIFRVRICVWDRLTKYMGFKSLFSSHRKNWFAARCEYLHLIKKNLQCLFACCEFFLIRCKHSQRAANQFLR